MYVQKLLKKILRSSAGGSRHGPLVVWYRGKYCEPRVEVFAEVHNGRNVSAAVAIVWGAPDSHNGFVVEVPL